MAQMPSSDFCNCCEPGAPLPLALVENRPGLSAIRWRSGTYASFREAMIQALAAGGYGAEDADDPQRRALVRAALQALGSRRDDDYSIMMIDLFAAVADVLSFYNERYANEMYLRTARDRDSLLRLTRMIGYELSPGIAATTVLAFTLDKGARVRLAPGLKVMSVPGQDEHPQTFETIAAVEADARLNDVPAFGAPAAIDPFAAGRRRFPILARPERLTRGDSIVIIGGGTLELGTVHQLAQAVDGEYLELERAVGVTGNGSVGFKIRRSLNLFGHNVPDSYSYYDANPALAPVKRWVIRKAGTDYSLSLPASLPHYGLDRKIDDLKQGALLLVDCGPSAAHRFAFGFVSTVDTDNLTLGPMSDTVTRIGIQPVAPLVAADSFALLIGQGLPQIPDLRTARVFELETPAIVPRRYAYPPALSGQTLYVRADHLDDPQLLAKKRRIVLSSGDARHVAQITDVTPLAPGSDGIAHSAIGFAPALGHALGDVRMNANAASASHGETQPDETLGHGDGSRVFQQFRLQRSPLTRLPSASGVTPRNELAVRVNGELWQEAPSLFGRGPDERIYITRTADDGTMTLRFGDGKTGARLPSGASNVSARYRTGLGVKGRLQAGQLSTLLSRPVGLRAVANPLPTDGGNDPETLEAARSSAPATVRTFGRAIALRDFEEVALQTGLAARARASWAWVGLERAVQLTVAGPDGARLSSDAMDMLHSAMNSVRDPNHPLIMCNLSRVPVTVTASLLRDRSFEADAVEAAARAALGSFLSFGSQALAQPLHLSQVVAALQTATGVLAVNVGLFRIKGSETWTAVQRARRGATVDPVQPNIRIFDSRPLLPPADCDPLSAAVLALDPGVLALPAEQAFVQVAASDVTLHVVEAL